MRFACPNLIFFAISILQNDIKIFIGKEFLYYDIKNFIKYFPIIYKSRTFAM